MTHEWIPITLETKMREMPCLLCDKKGRIYEGHTAFDFYDLEYVKYFFPMPKFPFLAQGFASNEAILAVLRMKEPK